MTWAPRSAPSATSSPPVTTPAPWTRNWSPPWPSSASPSTCPADSRHAERYRGDAADVPAAGADELIPIAHTGRHHLDKNLIRRQRPRFAHVDQLDPSTNLPDPCYLHRRRLSLWGDGLTPSGASSTWPIGTRHSARHRGDHGWGHFHRF